MMMAELVKLEDIESGRKVNSKNLGQKRMQVTRSPDREKKRRRLVNLNESRKDEAMRKCGVILEKLMNHKYVVASGFRDYRKIIRCPMDLATVKLKLEKGVYENSTGFAKDVKLIFHFARLYNQRGNDVHVMATVLLELFDMLFDSINNQSENIVEERKFRTRNPRMRREMSDSERNELGLVLQDFVDEYQVEILEILGKRNSTTPDADGEIEADVHALDKETMWDLHKFLRLKLKAQRNNSRLH